MTRWQMSDAFAPTPAACMERVEWKVGGVSAIAVALDLILAIVR